MFACFYVFDFPVQACLLPELAEARRVLHRSPLAILDGPANLPRVFATNAVARHAGIQIGMTKLQVETYSGVLLRTRSIAMEGVAQNTLVQLAGTFSPRVESTCPGAVIMDLAGTEKLLGPWKNATHTMVSKAAAAGLNLRIAIAANPDAAFHAASGFSANTIIPAGEETRKLASLSVSSLPASPEILEILDGWGIRTFESLAALPEVAVVERLGQEGLYFQKLARGRINRPLLTVRPVTDFVERFEFDDPVETLESLLFILNRLLQRLCSRLISASLATHELRLTMGLEVRQIQDGQEGEGYKHDWKLPVPTQDKNLLFGLVCIHLEKATFTAPIRKLTLEVIPVNPRVAQGNLFAPPSPEPEKLEITLERIREVVGSVDEEGAACVGSSRLLDNHKPGSFSVEHFSGMGGLPDFYQPQVPVSALRVFRPAIETSVQLQGERPHFVRLWRRHRRVLAASGPWSSSGSWWNSSAWAREEWDVLVRVPAGVGLYRIYHDYIRKQWFVEGVFD
ncbi:MAG TPA: DNA polymerase Y family protein [Terriglobales bacterium]|nr:DNA polymerase Y family protein [Terriglobales bacterium]